MLEHIKFGKEYTLNGRTVKVVEVDPNTSTELDVKVARDNWSGWVNSKSLHELC